MKYMKQ